MGDAHQVTPEHAGVAEGPKQNQPIGRGLEPAADPAFQRLSGLRVVIVHERHRQMRTAAHQRSVKEMGHVIEAVAARLPEMEVQRHIEQAHPLTDRVQIASQHAGIVMPVLAHREQLPTGLPAQRVQPFPEEARADVLHRVQPEAVTAGSPDEPQTPPLQLLANLRRLHVHVQPHQVVIVAMLPVHVLCPALALNAIESPLLPKRVPVGAREAACVPDEVAVASPPAREGEPGHQTGGADGRAVVVAALKVLAAYRYLLHLIAAHAVIQHHIRQRLRPRAVNGPDGPQVFRRRAVLGGDGALLVKLAQVIQIIDTIAHVVSPAAALLRRRQPERREAQLPQVKGLPRQRPPQRAVRRQIPLKGLQHDPVLHAFILPMPESRPFVRASCAPEPIIPQSPKFTTAPCQTAPRLLQCFRRDHHEQERHPDPALRRAGR